MIAYKAVFALQLLALGLTCQCLPLEMNMSVNAMKMGNNHPHLCVLARAHTAHLSYLAVLLSSLVMQPMPLTVFVVPLERARDPKDIQDVIDHVVDMWSRPCIHLVTLQQLGVPNTGKDYPDHGFGYTDLALKYLLQEHAECNYFLFTNGDNFYVKAFAGHVVPLMDSGLDLIGYEFLTHYRGYRHESDNLPVEFRMNYIDFGSAIVRREIIIATNATFVNERSMNSIAGADGLFFQHIASNTSRKVVLKNVLFLHQ
jgi:hypothetical protein